MLVVLGVALLSAAVYGDVWVGKQLSYRAEASNAPFIMVDKSAEQFEAKIEKLKDEVIAELEKCESGGLKDEDGIVVLDSNNKGSYGVMQWQKSSVIHYYQKMTGEVMNGRDAIVYALTADKARELAKWVVFETASGVEKDWYNCSKKYSLQSKVDLIKELEN